MENQEIPENIISELEKHVNVTMESKIKELAKELINEHSTIKDEARKNELENGLCISLNQIANRIDKG